MHVEDRLTYLKELMAMFSAATPSSPAWYQLVDQAVGTLLADEIERLENLRPEKG